MVKSKRGAVCLATVIMTDYSNRAITLATDAKAALSATVSRASRGILRAAETVRKRAESSVATAPRPFIRFKLESLHSYIHRIIISRRRSKAQNWRADGR